MVGVMTNQATTTETTDEDFVNELLEAMFYDGKIDGYGQTFAEEGMMTSNEGIVVRLACGSEFQLTIVRSR